MFEFASMFTDNMILQRDKKISVWGKGIAGEKFEIILGDTNVKSTVDESGKWLIELLPRGLGGALELTLKSNTNEIKLSNILMGDVWFCSGQSNMEWSVNLGRDAEKEIKEGNYADIRLFTVLRNAKEEYQESVTGKWEQCSSEILGEFTAVGYYFGRSLHKELNVPIGLINSSWGGTCVEAWSSRESLEADPDHSYLVKGYKEFLKTRPRNTMTLAEWEDKYWYIDEPPNKGFEDGWHQKEFDDSKWESMKLPKLWQFDGKEFNGCFWFRKEVQIPNEWVGHEIEVSVGACDKSEYTYVNGNLVGSMLFADDRNAWCANRKYSVSKDINNNSVIQIAVRVISMINGGGMTGPGVDMYVSLKNNSSEEKVSLAGDWKYDVEYKIVRDDIPDSMPVPTWGDDNQNSPFALFAGMVNPVIPFTLKGFIWYQGESNCDRTQSYLKLFPAMIKDWRQRWNEELPFYLVQLANYGPNENEDEPRPWSELRETQRLAADKLSNCEMACIIDIGESVDIHPKNKQDVGYRLSLLALQDCYAQELDLYASPSFKSAEFSNELVRVSFDQSKGLHCTESDIQEFELAGEDNKFYCAKATLEGDELILSSDQVASPLYVRYAWRKGPSVNLFNEINLPLAPFNTHPNLWQSENIKLKVPALTEKT